MTNDEAIRRGDAAKLVLDNDLVKEAFAEIEQTIIDQWRDLSIENKAQAEELKRLMWAAKQFKAIFEVTISGAVVARNELLNDTTMQIRADAAKRKLYG